MRWSYKTVHFSLKKEGLLGSAFLDEAEIEESLNEYGKTGWELVSFMEVNDGLIAVFKQPFGKDLPFLEEFSREEKKVEFEAEPVIPESKAQDTPKPSFVSIQQEESDVHIPEKKKRENDDADVGSILIA